MRHFTNGLKATILVDILANYYSTTDGGFNMKISRPSADEAFPLPCLPRYAPSKRIVMGKPGVVRNPAPAKISLPYGSKIGRLRVGAYSASGKCTLTCDCGYKGTLAHKTVRKLLKQGMGCGTADCTVDSFERMLWADVNNSLKIQLFLLTQLLPDEVPSRWGGQLDDFEEIDLDQAYANFLADELSGKPPETVKWIERHTVELPFMPGNVVMTGMPSRLLAKSSNMSIDAGAGEMLISEIIKFTGKTESEVLLKAFEMRTFDGVIAELI